MIQVGRSESSTSPEIMRPDVAKPWEASKVRVLLYQVDVVPDPGTA